VPALLCGNVVKVKGKGAYSSMDWKPITELRSVTCHTYAYQSSYIYIIFK